MLPILALLCAGKPQAKISMVPRRSTTHGLDLDSGAAGRTRMTERERLVAEKAPAAVEVFTVSVTEAVAGTETTASHWNWRR